jgi:hypothetical protein
MDDKLRKWRELDVLDNIATELMRLRVLKEHELGSTNSVFVSRSPRRRDLRAWHLRARSRDLRRVLGRGILQGVPALRFATTTGGMLVCRLPLAPPSVHQSTLLLPVSKRALKTLRWILTTHNGRDVRLGSP